MHQKIQKEKTINTGKVLWYIHKLKDFATADL